jgi:hypothetical protein
MKWFVAKIIYQIICGDGKHASQFDEQLRLINAEDDLHAFYKARHIGESEEDDFLNHINKPVQWKFIDVSEIYKLDKLIDGAEICSRICEEDNADTYIRNVQLRSKYLLEAQLIKHLV